MAEDIYRFKVHFIGKKGKKQSVHFVADIRPHLHIGLKPRLETLLAMRNGDFKYFPYMQRNAFIELWNAWEMENKKLVSTLPQAHPDKLLALKKFRQKEHGYYGNPKIMLELWDAWSRQFPKDAAKVERLIKKQAKPQDA
jgi:hypothetical protein